MHILSPIDINEKGLIMSIIAPSLQLGQVSKDIVQDQLLITKSPH